MSYMTGTEPYACTLCDQRSLSRRNALSCATYAATMCLLVVLRDAGVVSYDQACTKLGTRLIFCGSTAD